MNIVNKNKPLKPIIKMTDINKSYGGVKVLSDFNFELNKGEIHGLVGKNGAGKSTLMKILCGVESYDSGRIELHGQDIKHQNKLLLAKIAIIYQELSLIPTLSVARNICLNNPPRKNKFFIDEKKCNRIARDILDRLNINVDLHQPVENLSATGKQVIEIAKALIKEREILIMDEPTTSFTNEEIKVFFQLIDDLKRQNVSIVYISHNIKEIFDLCQRVTIIRNGKKVKTTEVGKTELNTVIQDMTGVKAKSKKPVKDQKRELSTFQNKKPILQVRDLSLAQKISNISFSLYSGEILGIVGLTGNGKTELLETLYGINKIEKGEVFIQGKKVFKQTPQTALKYGISLIPDERLNKALVVNHSIKDNIILPILDKLKNFFFINKSEISSITKSMIKDLDIVSTDLGQPVINLSGGNQQKVVIAKSLAAKSNILLMDEPTVGIDIEAKGEVVELIKKHVSKKNNAVIVVSAELGMIEEVCDRVLIMKSGKIVNQILKKEEIREDNLLSLIQ